MSIQFNARKAIEVLAENEGETATREKLKILNQLSTIPNVNIIPVEVLQLVIQILGETENRMIINSILSAIQHLASFERTRMLLGDETNCIQLLVPHMSQFNFPNIQSGALDAMAELLKGSKKNQENLIQFVSEFFNPLMGIIQRENDSITKKAFAVLDCLFENPFCVHAIFGDKDRYDEYLDPLLICLQIENNRLVLQWALQTIEKACKLNQLYPKHLIDIGIIDSLVQIILDPRNVSAQAVKVSALNALIHCVKYSNEAGLWAGESGIVEPIIEIMYHTSLELNSSNISLSYAQSNETQDLREACFELAMSLTNFEPGRSHARMLNSTIIISSTDTDLLGDIATTPKEDKQVKLDKLDVDTKILNPYFDEVEEKKENIDILSENKKKFISHTSGLNVLFAYVGQEDPNEKSDLKYKKHIKLIRKMAIMIISNISTIAENGVVILSREQKLLSFDHPMNIVDLLLDIIIHKKENEKDQTISKRRVDNDGKDFKLDIKQCIINAMGSFALHDDCIEKLGEMGVIKRLLKMIDEKNEAAEVAKLLAKMCEHGNFQKVLFEEAGLARVIKLLEAQDNPEDRLSGLMICLPLASNPNGCVALSRDGIDKKIRDISKREVVFEEVRKMAKQVIKVFKENNKSSLRATKGAVGGSDENGKPINNMNIFKFNYEEVARIDKEFVKVCEERICDLLGNPKFKLQINWRQVERLGEINFSDEAITLLGRLDLYEEFYMAIEAFVEAAEINTNIFNTNLPLVVLEVLPPVKKQENSKKDEDDEEAVPCELEIGDLIMKYKLSPDGILWTPKQLAGLISYELLGYDIIELNDMLIGDGEDRDDQYELGVDQLKKVCKDSRLALLGDINLLYFHIETTDLLWKAGFAESQQIVASKSVTSDEELFIKGWRILKMNKDGMLQERILLLTNTAYYTVCFDPKSKKIDFKHTKHHNIEDYFLCDVGKIVKSRHDNTSSTVHLYEDGRNKFALNLVTNEKPHVSKSQTKLEEEAEELEKIKRLSSVFHTAELKSQLSAIPSTLNSSTNDLLSQSDETISTEEELGKSLVLDEDEAERPSTAGKYCSIFLCPDTVPRGKQKFYLQEIAWCFRAVACCATRSECHNVFSRDIVKPIEGKLARFYNLTGMGKKKDNSIIAKHMESKMRREQEKQEERVKLAQVKGAKNIKEK